MALTRLTPMLHVADVERSLAFYRDHLGFSVVSPEGGAGGLAGGPIRRPGDPGAGWPVMFYFYPDDVESLHLALGSRGVEVGELCVTFYRMKEFSCLDPDGHMLTFGQETDEPPTPEPDEPASSRPRKGAAGAYARRRAAATATPRPSS